MAKAPAKRLRLPHMRSVARELAIRARVDAVDALGRAFHTIDRRYLDLSA